MSKIKDLPKFKRPREKLFEKGPDALKDHELLAILLRTGTKDIDVIRLAKKVIRKYKKTGLNNVSVRELQKNFGIGPAKACEIIASFEFAQRIVHGKNTVLVLSPEDVFVALKDIRDNKKEHFIIFYLDVRKQEITRDIISIGTLDESLVHPREVFEPAVQHLSAHIVVAHNHPSGIAEPSVGDIKVTKKLFEAGKILGIDLLDHVIVTKNKFFSFRNMGILDKF